MQHEDSYSLRQIIPIHVLFFNRKTHYLEICNFAMNFDVNIHFSKERSLVAKLYQEPRSKDLSQCYFLLGHTIMDTLQPETDSTGSCT